MCMLFLGLPLSILLIPIYWIRYEVLLAFCVTFGMHNAQLSHTVYHRYIEARIRTCILPVSPDRVLNMSTDDFLMALDTATRVARNKLYPPPIVSSPSSPRSPSPRSPSPQSEVMVSQDVQ